MIGQVSIDDNANGNDSGSSHDGQEMKAVNNPSKGITLIYKRVVSRSAWIARRRPFDYFLLP